MSLMSTRLFVWFSIIILSFSFSCVPQRKPYAIQGIMDLRKWNFGNDGIIALDGMWEFYWHQLICSGNDGGKRKPELTGYFQIPKSWNGYRLKNQGYIKEDGFASFRLIIYFNTDQVSHSINIKYMNTAYRLYVNGEKIMENGRVGRSKEDTMAIYRPLIRDLPINSGSAEIVLEIANYQHKNGGPINSIYLGRKEIIEKDQFSRHFLYISFFGFFLIIFLYYIIIYLINLFNKKGDLSLLYFGFFCLINAFKICATEKYVIALFPGIYTFTLDMKLGYFSYYCSLPVFYLFIYFTFHSEIIHNYKRKLFFFISCLTGFACTIIVLCAPVKTFQGTFIFYNVFALATGIVCLSITGRIIYRENLKSNTLLFWGAAVLFFSGLMILSMILLQNMV